MAWPRQDQAAPEGLKGDMMKSMAGPAAPMHTSMLSTPNLLDASWLHDMSYLSCVHDMSYLSCVGETVEKVK